MKIIRNLLYAVFGLETYLNWVSRIYIFLVLKGFLKSKYPEIFHLKNIVKPGFYCIDIGANLGYYSTFLSKLCQPDGKVFAVEPVPLFRKILGKNLSRNHCHNVEMYPFALGEKEETIQMGMPKKEGVIHHGMTKVINEKDDAFVEYFTAEMRIPDVLFSKIPKLDFVKCDVEGYEHFVFSNMITTLKKFKPLIQSELTGSDNREKVVALVKGLNYNCFVLQNEKFVEVQMPKLQSYKADFYFIPKNE